MAATSGFCALSVNVNKVASLRNSRHPGIPSVTRAALLCLEEARRASPCTHGPTRDNVTVFLDAVPGVQEVSIGHALIGDALELGYA